MQEYPVDSTLELRKFRRERSPAETPRQALEKSMEVCNYQVLIDKQSGGRSQ